MNGNGIVYVVDDDQAARASLALLLKVSGYEVRSFEGAVAFVEMIPTLTPGCVILDLRMPIVSGEEVLRKLASRREQLPSVVITGHGDVPLAVECIKGGALDFIEKPFERERVLASVAGALASLQVPAAEENPARAIIDALPLRQRQVLERVVAGYPNKTIAIQLKLSPRTVEVHRSRMMERLGTRNVSQTVQMALQAGIQPPVDPASDAREPSRLGRPPRAMAGRGA